MEVLNLVFGIILLVAAVFLVVAVLMQSGKSHNLSGSIAGGAETFFGKTKGKSIDKVLSKVTTIVAIVFVLIVIVAYVIQPGDHNHDGEGEATDPVETQEIVDNTDAETDPAPVVDPADETDDLPAA
ncbi:MAG: preprotein translocase subunit SecG [Clostridia bacterium]|nr:preprotein translocase subunit SecG [Clostridia bacterium]